MTKSPAFRQKLYIKISKSILNFRASIFSIFDDSTQIKSTFVRLSFSHINMYYVLLITTGIWECWPYQFIHEVCWRKEDLPDFSAAFFGPPSLLSGETNETILTLESQRIFSHFFLHYLNSPRFSQMIELNFRYLGTYM